MLKTLKDLFNAVLPPQPGRAAAPTEHTLELALSLIHI